MDYILKENERIDDLEFNNLKIIQNKDGFCFGIDSILLSDFAKDIKKNSKVLDLGTGSGIIATLLCEKTELKEIIGVEIQEEVAHMAQRSIILNKLENKFKVLNCDIKDLNEKIENNSIDAIVTNPPYKKLNTGKINENQKKLISRHEISANLDDFIKISKKLLKNNGSMYIVHKTERLEDILVKLRDNKLEPKLIRFIYSKINEDSKLVLIKAVKNAKPFLKVEKPLIIYNFNGKYTDEILEIYNKNRNEE